MSSKAVYKYGNFWYIPLRVTQPNNHLILKTALASGSIQHLTIPVGNYNATTLTSAINIFLK